MSWIIGGFVAAVLFETFFRTISNNRPEEKQKKQRVDISAPWYAYGLAGLFLLKNRKDRKAG